MTALINELCSLGATFASTHLFTFMFLGFGAALVLKGCVHYMMYAQFNFTKEFEKRVHRYLDKEFDLDPESDYEQIVGSVMQRTWVEIYQLRLKNMRRKLDRVASFSDRLFLVEEGAKRLITDTLKEAKYVRPGQELDLQSTSRFVLSVNPYFTSLFGVMPVRTAKNLLAIMPGLFIIGGIFGTFLGITAGIPSLKGMDPTNAVAAKTTMGFFLDNMAFSLNTSVIGIFFSVCLTVVNSIFSTKQVEKETMHKLVHGLELLWQETKYQQTERLAQPPVVPKHHIVTESSEEDLLPPLPIKSA